MAEDMTDKNGGISKKVQTMAEEIIAKGWRRNH